MTPLALGAVGDREGALDELVARARATIPFYGAHLAGTEGRAFAELPTCTKADLAPFGPLPLHAGAPSAAARFAATSGTTGPRLLVGYSDADWERLAGRLAHRAHAAGLGPGDVFANTHGYGLWIGGPSLDVLARSVGAALVPVGPGSTEQLLRWIPELGITALSATPSFLRFLADRLAGRAEDVAAWPLRVGFVGGEGASPALRRQVVEAFGGGFTWQELYGSTEAGGPVLGWSPPQDPLGGLLLVDTEEFVVEVLRVDADEPAEPGALGELVITTPWREQSPLIRYRTRDLTVARPDVVDPSGFPVVAALRGRVDDAIKVRGALVYPAVIEHLVVGHCPPGCEWRVDVDRPAGGMDVLTVVVEHDEPDAGGLADVIAAGIGVRPVVRAVAPGSLDRFEGKARRTTDHR